MLQVYHVAVVTIKHSSTVLEKVVNPLKQLCVLVATERAE